ncbi:MAG: hypothetical protein H8D23_16150 [Candidatus Brocadiales bacterium]|nr:hypothetical protein [Candidatus Brocadiales bacterium]
MVRGPMETDNIVIMNVILIRLNSVPAPSEEQLTETS